MHMLMNMWIGLRLKIKEAFPEREVVVAYLTPVVGAHTGPKGIGVGYIKID